MYANVWKSWHFLSLHDLYEVGREDARPAGETTLHPVVVDPLQNHNLLATLEAQVLVGVASEVK